MMRVYVHPFYHRMTVNEIPFQMAVYLMWLIVCPLCSPELPRFLDDLLVPCTTWKESDHPAELPVLQSRMAHNLAHGNVNTYSQLHSHSQMLIERFD